MLVEDISLETRDALLSRFVAFLKGGNELSFRSGPAASTFREVWTISGLNGSDFATRLATFLQLPTIAFSGLSMAVPLIDRFAPRFLKDFSAYPFINASGEVSMRLRWRPDVSPKMYLWARLTAMPGFPRTMSITCVTSPAAHLSCEPSVIFAKGPSNGAPRIFTSSRCVTACPCDCA